MNHDELFEHLSGSFPEIIEALLKSEGDAKERMMLVVKLAEDAEGQEGIEILYVLEKEARKVFGLRQLFPFDIDDIPRQCRILITMTDEGVAARLLGVVFGTTGNIRAAAEEAADVIQKTNEVTGDNLKTYLMPLVQLPNKPTTH